MLLPLPGFPISQVWEMHRNIVVEQAAGNGIAPLLSRREGSSNSTRQVNVIAPFYLNY
jgi:hypothetical protein